MDDLDGEWLVNILTGKNAAAGRDSSEVREPSESVWPAAAGRRISDLDLLVLGRTYAGLGPAPEIGGFLGARLIRDGQLGDLLGRRSGAGPRFEEYDAGPFTVLLEWRVAEIGTGTLEGVVLHEENVEFDDARFVLDPGPNGPVRVVMVSASGEFRVDAVPPGRCRGTIITRFGRVVVEHLELPD